MAQILYKELSYKITGLCFKVHNELGRFCKEKQCADLFESLLKEEGIKYKREFDTKLINKESPVGNRGDFLIDDKVIVEFKVKNIITKEDYYQVQRYLKSAKLKLGLIFNFRNRYLKAKRVLNSSVSIK
ncbi:MAG: GxxExxY protein [Candidatus Gracilibacteria bacterium]|nr:GxxExxY protein [Candidatus Gracilibacteria bacterium]